MPTNLSITSFPQIVDTICSLVSTICGKDVIETKTMQLKRIILFMAHFLFCFLFFWKEEQYPLPSSSTWSGTHNLYDFIFFHSPPHAPGTLAFLLFLKHTKHEEI